MSFRKNCKTYILSVADTSTGAEFMADKSDAEHDTLL